MENPYATVQVGGWLDRKQLCWKDMRVHGGKKLNMFQQHASVAKKASPILASANRSAATEKLRTDPPEVLSNLNFSMTALTSSACLKDVTGCKKIPNPVAEFSFNINKASDALCEFNYLIKEENVVEWYIPFLGTGMSWMLILSSSRYLLPVFS